MKKLILLLCLACACCANPTVATAGNTMPGLYLELWAFDTEPVKPVPAYVCIHSGWQPARLHCHDSKSPNGYAVVALHVGDLDHPICSTHGPDCKGFGGWLGVSFGVSTSGEKVSFVSWNACPGFLKGPSFAGEPAACLASSYSGCHDWWDHLGYFVYANCSPGTGATYFRVTAGADYGHYKVINCAHEYDEYTQIGGPAQWGGEQVVRCALVPADVRLRMWDKISGLYR